MTCLVPEPTGANIDTLPHLILTSLELWDPNDHHNDDDIIVPLNSPMANALNEIVSHDDTTVTNSGGGVRHQIMYLIPEG
jgi:hypothetical protein